MEAVSSALRTAPVYRLRVSGHLTNRASFKWSCLARKRGARLSPLTLYRMDNGATQDINVDPPAGLESWDNIAAHFIDSILDGKPCAAPLRHGLIVQQMMEALLLSADTGKEVRIETDE